MRYISLPHPTRSLPRQSLLRIFFLFSEQINNTAHRNLAPLYEALEKLDVDELVRDLLWNSQLHSAKRDLSPTLMVLSIKLLKISEMKFLSLQG